MRSPMLLVVCIILLASGLALAQVIMTRPGVEAWLEKECFSEGEELIIHVRSSHAGYLTIIDITPDGMATLLFPNAYVPRVMVQAGREYVLPSPGAPFKIRVSIPIGVGVSAREKIWVIATETPLEISPFAHRPVGEVVGEVERALDALPFGTWWAAAVVEFGYGPCEEAASPVGGVEREIEELNREIAAAGGNWKAGFTCLSDLPSEELELRCGVINVPLDPSRELRLPYTARGLPSLLDWRDFGGDWTTPVKDQGPCGSCWIFGPVAVFEALLDVSSQDPTDMPFEILSEQYVLSYIRSGKGCDGGPPTKAMEFLVKEGTVTATCFPYMHDDTRLEAYSGGCLKRKLYDWGGLQGDLSREPPKPVPVDKIKTAIYTYGPVTAAMAIYEDFVHYKSGVYTHVKGEFLGYHMVLIVGWEDGTRSWICKNSWGPCWGDHGWFQIKWGDSSIGYIVLAGMTEETARYVKKYGSLYEYMERFKRFCGS